MLGILTLIITLINPVRVEFSPPVPFDSVKKFDHAPVGQIFTQPDYKSWTFIGPKPIHNEPWSGNADVSGRVTSIAVDPTNTQVAYITGAQGGVWKTTDGGANWTPLTDGLSSLASGYVTIDPNNNLTLYYGTGELHYCGDCFYGDGLFKSTDGGQTWTKIASTSQVGTRIAKVLVNPSNSNTIFVASNAGLVVSRDGGSSWSVALNVSHCNDVEINPSNTNIIYASFYGYGVYKSTDGGYTWTKLTNGLPSTGFTRIELAIAPSSPDVVYASFASSVYNLLGLYKTTDGGASWTILSNTPDYLVPQGFYDHCIIVDPTNPNIVYAGGVYPYDASHYGLVMTTDGGNTWTDITFASDNTKLHPDMQALFISSDGVLWVATDGGVWKTSNPGATWTDLNATLAITQFYTVGLHPTRSDSMLGGTQDNGTPIYTGTVDWNELSSGDGGPCLFDWYDPGYYMTSYVQLQNILLYHNGSFQSDIAGPWVGERASWANGPLVMDPSNHNTIYVGTYRVWKTTDYGNSWTAISGDLTSGSGYLLSLAIPPSNTNIIYTGSSDGYVYVYNGAWTRIDGGTFGSSGITDIIVNPSNSQEIYLSVDASSGSRVYKSSNGGTTWTDLTGSLPSGLRGLSLAVDFTTATPQIYLGTDYGVYFTADNGTTWSLVGPGLPKLAIFELKIDTANNYLVAASHGRGMWRTQLISTSVSSPSVELPEIKLGTLTHGKLLIPDPGISGSYQISIYSGSGRLVKRKIATGSAEFSLKPGIYFVNIRYHNQYRWFKVEVIK